MATETTYSSLRQNLSAVLDRVSNDNEIYVVRRKKGSDIALVSADELSGILETAHLLRSPANAARLIRARRRAERGILAGSTIEELKRDVGLSPKRAAK